VTHCVYLLARLSTYT